MAAEKLMTLLFRRKNYLINPKFQIQFLSYMIGAAAITFVIFYSAKIIFFLKIQQYLTSIGIPPTHTLYEFLAKQSKSMDVLFLIAGTIELALLAVFGILLSHKIAGPLYRLYHDMVHNAEGNTPKTVRFRKGDYFLELADAHNRQLERFIK